MIFFSFFFYIKLSLLILSMSTLSIHSAYINPSFIKIRNFKTYSYSEIYFMVNNLLKHQEEIENSDSNENKKDLHETIFILQFLDIIDENYNFTSSFMLKYNLLNLIWEIIFAFYFVLYIILKSVLFISKFTSFFFFFLYIFKGLEHLYLNYFA